MAQQNVPPAFTEYESSIKIPTIRSAFQAMARTGCNDSLDVTFWLDTVEDEELLKCFKIFESFKKSFKPLLSLYKKPAYDDKEAVRAYQKNVSNDTESFNTIFARLALLSSSK